MSCHYILNLIAPPPSGSCEEEGEAFMFLVLEVRTALGHGSCEGSKHLDAFNIFDSSCEMFHEAL